MDIIKLGRSVVVGKNILWWVKFTPRKALKEIIFNVQKRCPPPIKKMKIASNIIRIISNMYKGG